MVVFKEKLLVLFVIAFSIFFHSGKTAAKGTREKRKTAKETGEEIGQNGQRINVCIYPNEPLCTSESQDSAQLKFKNPCN